MSSHTQPKAGSPEGQAEIAGTSSAGIKTLLQWIGLTSQNDSVLLFIKRALISLHSLFVYHSNKLVSSNADEKTLTRVWPDTP